MKIIIAPDSFKGSISAKSLCSAIQSGIKNVYPTSTIVDVPMADGGEGTMENLVHATNGKIITLQATDPMGRQIETSFGVLGDGKTAVIEMAQVSGLPLIEEDEKNPLIASSFGTGELIVDALNKGYREFIIGLGGSATNDGGVGMLKALGVTFYKENGEPIDNRVDSLLELSKIDTSGIDPRIKEASFIIASDVTNPLCGVNGASYIFGPQKGANPEMVKLLDQSLKHYGQVIDEQFYNGIETVPGAGAAGGMGAALIAFLQAEVRSGIEMTLEVTSFRTIIKDADLIITGEGRLDKQTLSGKVIYGISKIAQEEHVPVIALCGLNELHSEELDELGVASAFSIVPGPCSLEVAMSSASEWATHASEMIMRLYKTNR